VIRKIVWKRRLCFIDIDGTLIMSGVGASLDFDFARFDSQAAVAIRPPDKGKFLDMAVLDSGRLLLTASGGRIWLLTNDPANGGALRKVTLDVQD
jgi:hypothetical protein